MTKEDYSVAAPPKNESSGRGGGGGVRAAAAAPTTGLGLRTWLGLKDPRIVRVSRSFGGKDRHSKVCTVKGLRDRRVRLSVQTAIQLYDLQERLGLSQPSKVVDWLLNVTQTEIDKLPPLQMPLSSYPTGQFMPSGSYSDTSRSNTSTAAAGGGGWKLLVSNADDRRKNSPAEQPCREDSDHAAPGGGGGGGSQFLHSNSTFVFPTSTTGSGVYSTASFFHMDVPPPQPPAPEPAGVTMACMFSSQEANHQTELSNGFYHHHRLMSPPGSLSLMAGARQLMLSPVMPTVTFHSRNGASPVVDHVVSGHHVVAAPTTTTAATSQNFFSSSLFASFPSVVPAATHYHIPK